MNIDYNHQNAQERSSPGIGYDPMRSPARPQNHVTTRIILQLMLAIFMAFAFVSCAQKRSYKVPGNGEAHINIDSLEADWIAKGVISHGPGVNPKKPYCFKFVNFSINQKGSQQSEVISETLLVVDRAHQILLFIHGQSISNRHPTNDEDRATVVKFSSAIANDVSIGELPEFSGDTEGYVINGTAVSGGHTGVSPILLGGSPSKPFKTFPVDDDVARALENGWQASVNDDLDAIGMASAVSGFVGLGKSVGVEILNEAYCNTACNRLLSYYYSKNKRCDLITSCLIEYMIRNKMVKNEILNDIVRIKLAASNKGYDISNQLLDCAKIRHENKSREINSLKEKNPQAAKFAEAMEILDVDSDRESGVPVSKKAYHKMKLDEIHENIAVIGRMNSGSAMSPVEFDKSIMFTEDLKVFTQVPISLQGLIDPKNIGIDMTTSRVAWLGMQASKLKDDIHICELRDPAHYEEVIGNPLYGCASKWVDGAKTKYICWLRAANDAASLYRSWELSLDDVDLYSAYEKGSPQQRQQWAGAVLAQDKKLLSQTSGTKPFEQLCQRRASSSIADEMRLSWLKATCAELAADPRLDLADYADRHFGEAVRTATAAARSAADKKIQTLLAEAIAAARNDNFRGIQALSGRGSNAGAKISEAIRCGASAQTDNYTNAQQAIHDADERERERNSRAMQAIGQFLFAGGGGGGGGAAPAESTPTVGDTATVNSTSRPNLPASAHAKSGPKIENDRNRGPSGQMIYRITTSSGKVFRVYQSKDSGSWMQIDGFGDAQKAFGSVTIEQLAERYERE